MIKGQCFGSKTFASFETEIGKTLENELSTQKLSTKIS